MTAPFASRINRHPRAFDTDRGQEIAQRFDTMPPEVKEILIGAGGSSPYLFSLMEKEQDWLCDTLTRSPEDAFTDILKSTQTLSLKQLPDGLRMAKRRVALLTGLCDLAGVWQLGQVTTALTEFADLAVDLGVKALVAAEIDRGKLPGASDADKATAAGISVLAMGKGGAYELNYSSDIDLICLFDETRFEPDDHPEARAAFVRVTRRLCKMLSDMTAEGYVFRTDLRLRPDPSVTPVCLSMAAAESYYESVGRTWERAAHIKARACAGDIAAGQAYLKRLTPFVWRKHLDFAAIQDAHDMRLRIRDHKGLHGPIVLEGHNMKLGVGGIREIEFFTQTRQIIAGGRDTDLRVRGTLDGLDRLARKGWVPEETARMLSADYIAHRETEHRLQMVADAQTHDLPKDQDGFARLAAMFDQDVSDLRDDIAKRLTRVFELTEGFFAPAGGDDSAPAASDMVLQTIEGWQNYPALRSARAGDIFNRLKPEIIKRLNKAARPDQAVIQFDTFLRGLPGGVQVFALFEANPHLIDLMVDIAASSPRLAQYLGQNSQVFDAVIGGDFFAPWPDQNDLSDGLNAVLETHEDYEGKLDAARRFQKEWHFKIGVHHLRGLINADEAGAQYAALADAILVTLWPAVVAEFSRKHGPQPGRGAAIIGMGSLGAQRLGPVSDLDLIVVYDDQGEETSQGRRPLASRTYYARLTQALVTALSAPMAEGRLYEVDMRLRPSGRQGPVATSWAAFKSYQVDEAWTWEHLALTRARPVAGNPELMGEIELFRQDLLAADRDSAKVLGDVQDMRGRLSEAKPAQGIWDAKRGPGRLQDIELMAQACALLSGSAARQVPGQLQSGVACGLIGKPERDVLTAGFSTLWTLQVSARLLTGDMLDPDDIGQGGLDFLMRETGAKSAKDLAEQIAQLTAKCAGMIRDCLGRGVVHPNLTCN